MRNRKLKNLLISSLTLGLLFSECINFNNIHPHASSHTDYVKVIDNARGYKWVNNIDKKAPSVVKEGTIGHIDEHAWIKHYRYHKYDHLVTAYGNYWLRESNLRATEANTMNQSATVFPYQYTSQFWPSRAKNACEIASLKMALSAIGIKTPDLKTMVKKIPVTGNPNTGYSGNPFHWGTGASIYPRALVKVARNYKANAVDATGIPTNEIVNDLQHHQPLVFEGTNEMQYSKTSDHVLVILGYKPGYFYWADPWSKTKNQNKFGWIKINKFNRIFHGKKQGARAVCLWK